MGLCKCPRKKVTNQFCFEHKVNVCEYCMVDGPHKTCIVGPYLNWLENSSYDPNCQLCKAELHHAECARLGCYHIFHLECINNYGRQFPPNTAPAGYTCPTCSSPIFSMSSSKTPVVAHLEKLLSQFSWAQEGIGSTTGNQSFETNNVGSANYPSLLDDSTRINMPSTSPETNNFSNPKIIHNSLNNKLNNSSNYSVAPVNVINNVTSYISTNSDLSFGSTSSMRSKFDNLESRRPLLASVDEVAEDKYRTKSPIEFVSRWLRSRSTYMRNQATMSSMSIYKRFIIYGFLAFLFLFVLVHYFIKYGRQAAENDPFLDPENDPNLRHADD